MSDVVERQPVRPREGRRRLGRTPATALFWRLLLLNAHLLRTFNDMLDRLESERRAGSWVTRRLTYWRKR
jgi:hypothetical protein